MIDRPFPLRILVHSEVVGAIIGRSGSTIRNITQQTNAKIDVHRDKKPEQQEKIITINGSPDNCSEACSKIIEVVQAELNAKYDTASSDRNRNITLKILISSSLIGRLIGKSGSSIRKMMEQTSTRIKISTNSITDTTGEHSIIVVGKLEQVKQAERLISAKLRAAFASDMNTSLQTMGHQPYLFNNVLLPYMPSPYQQNSILASIVNPQAGHGGNSMPRQIPLSTPHQMPGSMYTAPGYLPLYSNPSGPPGASSLMGYNTVAPGFEQERETVYIYIPSTMVGAIIGKSGAAIKEMISTSGASIKVTTVPHPSEPQRNDQNLEQNQKVDNTESFESANDEATTNRIAIDDSAQQTSAISPRASRFSSASIDPSTTRKVTIVGYPASQYSAQYMIYRKIAMESAKSDISLMVELYIPSEFVGKIIGRGGANIKFLQKQTRTTIRLPNTESESEQSQTEINGGSAAETCVQITGEFMGSHAAQRHIKNVIRTL